MLWVVEGQRSNWLPTNFGGDRIRRKMETEEKQGKHPSFEKSTTFRPSVIHFTTGAINVFIYSFGSLLQVAVAHITHPVIYFNLFIVLLFLLYYQWRSGKHCVLLCATLSSLMIICITFRDISDNLWPTG